MAARKSSSRLRRGLGFSALFLLSSAVAGCGGATERRPATWDFIAPAIIEPTCATASCHSEVAQRAGVVLEPRDKAYTTLTDRQFVTPRNGAESEIIVLMRAQGSRRMPPDFPLPEVDIQLIQQWIDDGALGHTGATTP